MSLDIDDLNEDGMEQPRMRGRPHGTSQQPNVGVQLLDGNNKPRVFSADVLSQMSVVQLRTLCAAHGLSTCGTKAVFRERILRKQDHIEGPPRRYPTTSHVSPPPSSVGDYPHLDARNCHLSIEFWPDERNDSIEHNVHLAECAWLSTAAVQSLLEVLLPPGTTSVKPVIIDMQLAQLMRHFPTLSLICTEKCALPLLLTSRNSTIGVHALCVGHKSPSGLQEASHSQFQRRLVGMWGSVCPVCHTPLQEKVSGTSNQNYERKFLCCPESKPGDRHQGSFQWTEPPKHVPHDWPDCSCGVPCQLKNWNDRYTFKCWNEYGGGCNFIRGATQKPETQHRDCNMCGFKLERQHSEVTENTPLSQTTPTASPSQSPRQEVPQSPEPKIRRTSLFVTSPNKQPSLPSSMAMEIKQAIQITMYETTASIVIIAHNGVTGSADANSVTCAQI